MRDFSRFYDDMADIMPKILMDRTDTPCRTRKVAKFLPFVRIFPCTRLTGIIFGHRQHRKILSKNTYPIPIYAQRLTDAPTAAHHPFLRRFL